MSRPLAKANCAILFRPVSGWNEPHSLDVHVTGTEGNVLGLLARLGWQTGWVSALPDTPLGRRVRNTLACGGD